MYRDLQERRYLIFLIRIPMCGKVESLNAGIETAGVLDIDSELIMTFANGTVLHFDFKSRVEIKTICANIQQYIL